MTTDSAQAGLYVHVPFCRTRCPYCAFHSRAVETIPADWTEAVAAEAHQYAGRFVAFDSLYLGGGTPSLLSDRDLERLVTALRRVFVFQQDSETTIEVNPGDVDTTRLRTMRNLGFNRVSIGIQSFCDNELLLLGRRHDAVQAAQALASARQAGFDNVGLDLMFGLPGQSLPDLMTNLERAVGFVPDHISCYALSVEPGTRFAKAVACGSMPPPDEATQADQFLAASNFLEAHGYEHYEVSNYARGSSRRSRHNQKYWHHIPYLGLGPAAHSLNGNQRWWNHADTDLWQDALARGQTPVSGDETLTSEQIAMERVALGLRTRDGVPRTAIPDTPEARSALVQFVEHGLLSVVADRVAPTRRGYLFADHMAMRLS